MKDSTQKIGNVWVVPTKELDVLPNKDFYSKTMSIYLSEDKQWWTADGSGGYHEGEKILFYSKVTETHSEARWEKVRIYIVTNLLPTLEPPPPYNDLDRFTDLEVT